ncbi:MAG: hypothetical protein HDR19_05165 [Lachnospiraceae bacterium]|nr:hypothetical protein [Lachnospiraceae bacterium]
MNKSDLLFAQYYEDVFRFLSGISADEHLAEENSKNALPLLKILRLMKRK